MGTFLAKTFVNTQLWAIPWMIHTIHLVWHIKISLWMRYLVASVFLSPS